MWWQPHFSVCVLLCMCVCVFVCVCMHIVCVLNKILFIMSTVEKIFMMLAYTVMMMIHYDMLYLTAFFPLR